MENNDASRNNDWLKKLDEELTSLGVRQGNFLKGNSGVYIPKKKS